MSDPVKQLHPQFLFQKLDLKGNGGLGVTQLFPGSGKASQLRRFDKNIQTAKIHK